MEQKKKVVLLSCFYEPFMSGAEQMPREIIRRLGGKYDITLVAARLDEKLPPTETRENYKLVRVGIGHKTLDKFLYPLLAALEVRRIKPEIAHANLESYAGIALAWLKRFSPRTKRILTLQSGNIDDPRQKNARPIKLFWRAINLSPDIILPISDYLRARSIKLGVPAEKIVVIPNGADLDNIPADIQPEEGRVFFAGRLSWEKGAEYMFRAWPLVLAQYPEARLVQAGSGDMEGKIIELIKELKIEDSVELKATISHDAYIKEFKKAEVVVCPSLAEGLGIAFIEAQACGRPVIGTRVGGIPDVITDGENGLLIEPRNSRAIAEAIIKLFKDKELAERLSERGLETSKRFAWENVIGKIGGIYEKCSQK